MIIVYPEPRWPVRKCLTPWLQQGGIKELKTNTSVTQQEEQTDAAEEKVIADNNLDVDYKPEGSDPEIKAVVHEEKSDAEYAKMELP